MEARDKTVRFFLFGWLLLNLFQSYFTELFHDEAYYWMFSQHLDWGYKDHPPAAPAFIWLGWQLFQNELGVRLLMVLASTATLWLAYKIIRPADVRFFFLLAFSMMIVNVGGFMAAPDVPLLFFTTLFFYFLKDYFEKDSWATAAGLALALTVMAYSKYHGALVLLLVLFSNLKLLKRPSIWLIPAATLLLYLPHLYWQWANDFPSFRYHFQDRGEDKYEWTFISDYMLGQLIIWGPLVSVPVFWAAWKFKSRTPFERTMQWVFFGIVGFFFYQSFQQRTEANWTTVVLAPLLLMATKQLENQPILKKWTKRLIVASLVLVALFRIYMVWDFLPKNVNPRNEFHGWRSWAADMSELAGDLPVVFYNRFQKPVKYLFYSRKPAHCLSVDFDTGTQFDLINESEEMVQGRRVINIVDDKRYFDKMDSIVTLPRSGKKVGYRIIDDFRSYNRLKVKVLDKIPALSPDTTFSLKIEISNPTDKMVSWDETGPRATSLAYIVIQYETIFIQEAALEKFPKQTLQPGEKMETEVRLRTPEQPGRYRFRFGFEVKDLQMGRNSGFYEMRGEAQKNE